MEEFNKLDRYALHDVHDEDTRQVKFLKILNDEIGMQLIVVKFDNYQEMIDKVINFEDKHYSMENHKRKASYYKLNIGAQQKPCTSSTRYNGPTKYGNYSHGHHNHNDHHNSNDKGPHNTNKT